MEEEATSWSARVDGISQAHEMDALFLEVAHKVHELLDAPAKPVELPDDEGVALPEDVERLLESRAVSDLPAHYVVEDLVASGACQRFVLNVETLVLGRDTGVADAHCGCSIYPVLRTRGEPEVLRTGYENGL